jgi:hypothetical protein
VPREEGVIVCGSPVGSLRYQREYIRSIVDINIKNQLTNLKRVFLTPNGTIKKENQTVYQLVRMCVPQQLTFLMRTCDPDAASEAARCLDVIIDEFLMLLFDGRRFLNDMNGRRKKCFTNEFIYNSVRGAWESYHQRRSLEQRL